MMQRHPQVSTVAVAVDDQGRLHIWSEADDLVILLSPEQMRLMAERLIAALPEAEQIHSEALREAMAEALTLCTAGGTA